MRSSTLLCLTAVAVAALLPTAAAMQARIVNDIMPPRGEFIQKGAAADPNCTTGVHNPSAAYPSSCCAKSCGSTCGASSCSGDCCTGTIAKSAPSCDVSAPPCIITNKACDPKDDPTQCAALVNLYAATNGDKWSHKKGWVSGSSYCGWEGIFCSGGSVMFL